MTNTPCPKCGLPTAAEATACASCGHAMKNGAGLEPNIPREKPVPPAEVSGWIIYPTPPEIREEMQRTFNEEAFLAELRETERNGGGELKDFIHELEQELNRRA